MRSSYSRRRDNRYWPGHSPFLRQIVPTFQGQYFSERALPPCHAPNSSKFRVISRCEFCCFLVQPLQVDVDRSRSASSKSKSSSSLLGRQRRHSGRGSGSSRAPRSRPDPRASTVPRHPAVRAQESALAASRPVSNEIPRPPQCLDSTNPCGLKRVARLVDVLEFDPEFGFPRIVFLHGGIDHAARELRVTRSICSGQDPGTVVTNCAGLRAPSCSDGVLAPRSIAAFCPAGSSGDDLACERLDVGRQSGLRGGQFLTRCPPWGRDRASRSRMVWPRSISVPNASSNVSSGSSVARPSTLRPAKGRSPPAWRNRSSLPPIEPDDGGDVLLLLRAEVEDGTRDLAVDTARIEHQHSDRAVPRPALSHDPGTRAGTAPCACRRSCLGYRSSRRRRRSRPASAEPWPRRARHWRPEMTSRCRRGHSRSGSCRSTEATDSWRSRPSWLCSRPAGRRARRLSPLTFSASTSSTLKGGLAITKSHSPTSSCGSL